MFLSLQTILCQTAAGQITGILKIIWRGFVRVYARRQLISWGAANSIVEELFGKQLPALLVSSTRQSLRQSASDCAAQVSRRQQAADAAEMHCPCFIVIPHNPLFCLRLQLMSSL
ncbi:hypothetical protein CDAR_24871 [Caerostris darwini]|uniref:Uncharacterized protein n=1 Tax=Caerostris darwini TaxID=1538125 RepID=A0AAV4NCQ6_9ARAC|nr:hypothetical protein CDAR_24871 [Caerostris darwini]